MNLLFEKGIDKHLLVSSLELAQHTIFYFDNNSSHFFTPNSTHNQLFSRK